MENIIKDVNKPGEEISPTRVWLLMLTFNERQIGYKKYKFYMDILNAYGPFY